MPKRAREEVATAAARCWLMKSEPNVFSIDDLRTKAAPESWDGVRNYQARNYMRDMTVGDRVLFYHSNAKPPGIVGLAEVSTAAYDDHTALDKKSKYHDPKATKEKPIWSMVDVSFVRKFDVILPLDDLKSESGLQGMVLLSRGRLSVQPVEEKHYDKVLDLAEKAAEAAKKMDDAVTKEDNKRKKK